MFPDVVEATKNLDAALRPDVLETELVRRPEFDLANAQVLAKLENLQKTGSFKFRGATAKLLSLSAAEVSHGVVTASTGNHGAAVATAAADRDIEAHVFVSDSADEAKIAKIADLGANVTVVPGDPVLAELAGRRHAAETDAAYVSPYNDHAVVAGQGTIACELLRQQPDLAGVLVAVGGGGLISGIGATIKHHKSDVRVVGVSAANSAAMHHSVLAGEIIDVRHDATLSDGTAGGIEPASITFEMCRQIVDDWLLIDEPAIGAALRTYLSHNHDVIEGSAAMALAAVADARIEGPVAVVLCGGNVSAGTLASVGAG